MSNVIKEINTSSPAYNKILPGEALIKINGNTVRDVLDYKYYAYDDRLCVTLKKPDGGFKVVYIKKSEGEDLGLEFETYLMDSARSCANDCVFCFVDQMPEGMRETLYFKDDDARLSFLTGNYITMTNISGREIQRIIDLKVSPINISVHAADPQLRCRLLGNERAGKCIENMKRLALGGITMNCQIVCCPGLNDGEHLMDTMGQLSALYPNVQSVAIVPVGLTKHREGLYPLEPFNEKTAQAVINDVESFSQMCLEKRGSRIFFCSDELYLIAKRPLPDGDSYEGYAQLENGVGMVRLLTTEFEDALGDVTQDIKAKPFAIATGVAAAPIMEKLVKTAAESCGKIDGRVYAIKNDFFGHTIDVAGLVTGGDLISQLRGRQLGERLLIPQNMLRHGEGVFLDDVTVEQVSQELNIPVVPVQQDGAQLLRAMMGEETEAVLCQSH